MRNEAFFYDDTVLNVIDALITIGWTSDEAMDIVRALSREGYVINERTPRPEDNINTYKTLSVPSFPKWDPPISVTSFPGGGTGVPGGTYGSAQTYRNVNTTLEENK